ncbi:MAG: carboxypeptidase-like regulatory domain-containing protein, partial [Dysgonamonadaceae bacterium]
MISAQKVNLNYNQKNLKTVLESITEQTGYTLAYSKEVVDLSDIVSINVANAELTQVLDQLLATRDIRYEIKDNKIYIANGSAKTLAETAGKSVQQNAAQVKGTISNENGEPIIGASIFVPGTSVGTISDVDGNFVLSVPIGSELEISYIGYLKQTFIITGPRIINVQLVEDVALLDELVVVGYGVQKKS